MNIVCSKEELLKGVTIVQKAVPTRTTMSILECILILSAIVLLAFNHKQIKFYDKKKLR